MHQSSRKARQRDAERPAAQQDLTPQRQRIEKTRASKGEIIRALRDPNLAKKLATGLDEMPGRRGIPEVNWRRWSSLWQPSGQRKERGNKKKGREAERGEKGGTEGQGWIPIPVGIEGMGKNH